MGYQIPRCRGSHHVCGAGIHLKAIAHLVVSSGSDSLFWADVGIPDLIQVLPAEAKGLRLVSLRAPRLFHSLVSLTLYNNYRALDRLCAALCALSCAHGRVVFCGEEKRLAP